MLIKRLGTIFFTVIYDVLSFLNAKVLSTNLSYILENKAFVYW